MARAVADVMATAAAVRARAELVAELLRLPYLTADEAAIIVDTSASTIRRACASGTLRAVRLGSKQWRVTPENLRMWLDAGGSTVDTSAGGAVGVRLRV
jgi:excisionase family DNA binding protein